MYDLDGDVHAFYLVFADSDRPVEVWRTSIGRPVGDGPEALSDLLSPARRVERVLVLVGISLV